MHFEVDIITRPHT